MKKILLLLSLVFTVSVFAITHDSLPTAQNVDVGRYIGKWYTIISLPQFFTRSCAGQTAEYGILNEKQISVHNVCIKESGRMTDIRGIGIIRDAPNNARLSMKFDKIWLKLLGIEREYVIIKLSEGYDSVLVGSTNRKSLSVLSRTPSLDPATLEEYKTLAKDLGFKVQKLEDSKY